MVASRRRLLRLREEDWVAGWPDGAARRRGRRGCLPWVSVVVAGRGCLRWWQARGAWSWCPAVVAGGRGWPWLPDAGGSASAGGGLPVCPRRTSVRREPAQVGAPARQFRRRYPAARLSPAPSTPCVANTPHPACRLRRRRRLHTCQVAAPCRGASPPPQAVAKTDHKREAGSSPGNSHLSSWSHEALRTAGPSQAGLAALLSSEKRSGKRV
jgi:hypothetical protein